LQLGANELLAHGEADDQHPEGADGSFIPWAVKLKDVLKSRFPLPAGQSLIPDNVLLTPKWLLEKAETDTDDPLDLITGLSLAKIKQDDSRSNVHGFYRARLTSNQRITPTTHWQDVRHISFDLDSGLQYEPGDIVAIAPKNFAEDVDYLLKLMNWAEISETPIEFKATTNEGFELGRYPLPISRFSASKITTLRELLTEFLDITAIPKRSFFAMLAHFTDDSFHKERLIEFTNPEYIDEFYDYTSRPRRGILEVLEEFTSVQIPWQWAASVIPPLRPRQFSIASGGPLKSNTLSSVSSDNSTISSESSAPIERSQGSHIEILVAIVKYRTIMRKIRRGVCTRYLASLPVGSELSIGFEKGSFPTSKGLDIQRPVVLVGPGTGLAPMRSLLYERLHLSRNSGHEPSILAQNVLFFGNRNRDADYFFEDEWIALAEEIPFQIYTAFSRDQKRKIYVQNLIREQSKLIYDLLVQKGGMLFICGSSGKMPQAVREALLESITLEGKLGRDESEAYLLGMEKEGRYVQETW
jgi:sulfite reductase alpha subunit-like flavoprotein